MSYNIISYLNKWIGKTLLLIGWILIRIKSTVEILKGIKKTKIKKELESSLAKLKSKFK